MKSPLGEADKKLKEELEGRVKLLTDLADKYEDLGNLSLSVSLSLSLSLSLSVSPLSLFLLSWKFSIKE